MCKKVFTFNLDISSAEWEKWFITVKGIPYKLQGFWENSKMLTGPKSLTIEKSKLAITSFNDRMYFIHVILESECQTDWNDIWFCTSLCWYFVSITYKIGS